MQILALEYLLRTKRLFPDKIAVVDSNKTITFAELWQKSLALADQINQRPIKPGCPIVINIDKSIDAIVAILAVQWSGNIYVPLDPATPPLRRQRMLETLGRSHIISVHDSEFLLDEAKIILPDYDGARSLESVERRLLAGLAARKGIDPLYIIFTSGTTGTPKGVTISNAAVIDYIDWAINTYQISDDEIIGNQAPLYFDNSVLDLYLMLACGCTLHLIPATSFLFPNDVLGYIAHHSISFIFFVPSILSNFAALDAFSGLDLGKLRKVLFAGEMMPLNTLRYLHEHLPNALLSNLYGPTEITVDAIYWIFGDELPNLTRVPLGLPCRNKSIILTDAEGVAVQKQDEVAEICVSGIGVALGYWNNPSKTAEVFVQNPVHDNYRETIYKTGDLGYVSAEDGLIYMIGRKDSQIKHSGYRIELGEIEHALTSLEQVAQCCVLYDEEQKEIVAFYTLTAGTDTPLANPQSMLLNQLPRYMLPRRYISREHMPTTRNGKIDREALWADYENRRNS